MGLHAEIIKSTIASISVVAITFWVFGINWAMLFKNPIQTVAWLIVGLIYYVFFEYVYHKILLHVNWRMPILKQLFLGHQKHHGSFHGNSLTSRDTKRHEGTVTSWHIFPILFWAHFFFFRKIFSPTFAFPFFLSITFCFIFFYQVAHHLAHIGDNAVDRFIIQKTIFGKLRKRQIDSHLLGHHRKHEKNLNFFPECPADRIFGTYEK